MTSVLDKYFSKKKSELVDYINEILIVFQYKLDVIIPSKLSTVKKILDIYYSKYYMMLSNDYSIVNKHYKFDSETDNDIKIILQCVIEHYEKEKLDIKNKNIEIIYLSYIIYFAFLINRLRDAIVIVPNKSDFIISIAGKVSQNFIYKKDDKTKIHMNKLLDLVKTNTKDDKRLRSYLRKSINNSSYNDYLLLNENNRLYQVKYNYILDDIKTFQKSDIEKVNNKIGIDNTFILISYELAIVSLLKCILYDQRICMAFKVNKNFYKKKTMISTFIKPLKNRYMCSHISLIIDSDEYEECEELNKIMSYGIKIFIDCNKLEDVSNIKFSNDVILIANEEYITKYKENIESKKIKYIKKCDEKIYKEDDLIFTKLDFMEVNNE